MRKATPNLIRLLVALAIVCSLVAIVAAPAGAITAGFTVTNTPTTISTAAQYSMTFTALPGAGSYIAGTDYFVVTFPAGTTLPASMGLTTVTMTAGGNTGYAAASVSGQAVTVMVPATTLGGLAFGSIGNNTAVTIVFTQSANVQNPATVASTWTLTVSGVFSGGGGGTEVAATSATYSTTAPATILNVSPTSGPRGTSITLSGSGFTANTVATVTVGATVIAYTTVSSTGTVTYSTTASVPPFAAGANTITVTDGGGKTANTTFTVKMGITIVPTTGRPGDTITIIGTDTTALNLNSTKIGGLATTHGAQGAGWTSFTVTIPAGLAPGTVVVLVTDAALGTATANLTIQGVPITVTPDNGAEGTQVTISGSGFTPSTTLVTYLVTLLFGGGAWAANIPVDTSGNILTVQAVGAAQQALGPGTWTVTATDNAAVPRMGIAYYTIPPRTLTLSPTESGAGSSVLATGTGYSPNTMFTVMYGATLVVSGMTSGVGGITAQFNVPITAIPNSTNTVTADDATTIAAPKTATHKVPASAVTVNPTNGEPGKSVSISLAGFPAFATVTQVMFGPAIVTPSPAPYTGATGSVSFNVTVPAALPAPVLVTVTAGGTTGSTSFTVLQAPATVESALAPIASKVVIVWGYINGEWKYYDPADPVKTLTGFVPGQGYWIKVTEACTLIHGANTYNFIKDWNNPGWR